MARPLDPILGPDGKRLWVTAREHIGAEEINAACEWTQRVHRGLSLEHSVGENLGHHHRAFHAVGALRFVMPRWAGGEKYMGRVYPDSVLFDRTEEAFPGTYAIEPDTTGLFTITMSPGLPSAKYWVHVHGQPHPIQGGFRRVRLEPASRTPTSFQLRALGSPATSAASGWDRMQLVAVIYAETRS